MIGGTKHERIHKMAKVDVKVNVIQTAFRNGLDSMKKQTQTWAKDMGKMFIGAFAIGAVIGKINSLREELDRVGKLATRLNVLPSTIEKLGHAAKLAGSDVEMVVKTMSKLAVASMGAGDAFAKSGIDAKAFAGADVETQVLMLAEAYQKAGSDISKTMEIQRMLGEEGQNLIPLLKQGPEAIKETMGEASAGYDNLVAFTESLNDFFADVGRFMTKTVGTVFGKLQRGLYYVLGLMEGGTEKAKQNLIDLDSQTAKSADAMAETRKKAMESLALEEAIKDAEKAKKAFESVAEKLEQRAIDRLDIEGQILAMQEKQLNAMERMENLDLSADDRAKAAKESLDLQDKIEAAEAKISADKIAADEKLQAEKDKAEQAVTDANQKVADEEDRQSMAAMDPADRAAELQKRQADLFAQSQAAKDEGDDLTAAEKRLEGLQMADSIAQALADAAPEIAKEEEQERQRASVVSSSLAAVGGGGGSFVSGMDPQLNELKQQTRLLEQIATATNMQVQQPNREVF